MAIVEEYRNAWIRVPIWRNGELWHAEVLNGSMKKRQAGSHSLPALLAQLLDGGRKFKEIE